MNTLIAYFTYTGHTKGIASQIQEQTGGVLFEIKPATPYSADYDTTERQGRKETQDGYHPTLAEQIPDFDSYDTILLGTPNWFNTVAPPVATFLSENNFAGKEIALFCTNGGGGLGHMVTDIQGICHNAKILGSISIYEDGGLEAKKELSRWLKQIGLKK